MKSTKAERNHNILLARQAGMTIPQLGEAYGLAPQTISAILSAEKNKLALSPDKFYRALRHA